MDFDEALQVLGVSRAEGQKTARRAYLKLIKKHKPDRDPEGFQRVRGAWERVQHAWEWSMPEADVRVVEVDGVGTFTVVEEEDEPPPEAIIWAAAEDDDEGYEEDDYDEHEHEYDEASVEHVEADGPAYQARMLLYDAVDTAESDPKRALEMAQEAVSLSPYDLPAFVLVDVLLAAVQAGHVEEAAALWTVAEPAWDGGVSAGLYHLLAVEIIKLGPTLTSSLARAIITSLETDDFRPAANQWAIMCEDQPYTTIQIHDAVRARAPILAGMDWLDAPRDKALDLGWTAGSSSGDGISGWGLWIGIVILINIVRQCVN